MLYSSVPYVVSISVRLSFRYVLLLFILFLIPGVVMIIAYGLISRELYRGIQFELSQNKETTGEIRHKSTPTFKKLLVPPHLPNQIYSHSIFCPVLENEMKGFIEVVFFPLLL